MGRTMPMYVKNKVRKVVSKKARIMALISCNSKPAKMLTKKIIRRMYHSSVSPPMKNTVSTVEALIMLHATTIAMFPDFLQAVSVKVITPQQILPLASQFLQMESQVPLPSLQNA